MKELKPIRPVAPVPEVETHSPVKVSRDLGMVYISIAALLMASLGMLAGFGIYKYSSQTPSNTAKNTGESEQVAVGQFADAPDAEGTLVAGGVDGEGTHKLERGMGADKDVYLLSTVISLDGFVGKKVQIWGNTLSSQEAGWLIDVGRVKIIE